MADNQTNRLSELLRNYNGEGPATSNLNMLAQGLRSRNKEPMNKLKPFSLQDFLDMSALATSPVPVVGDAVGIGADAYRYATDPSSRTPLNFGLTALSAIPFLPPLVSAGLGKFAQSQGKTLSAPSMTGPARNQAGAIVYHGSPHKFDAFDSSKIGTGEGKQQQGIGMYLAESEKVAQKYADKESWKRGMESGYLYKVDAPDDMISSMASHELPLSKQPKSVKDAIDKMLGDAEKKALLDYHGWKNPDDAPFSAVMDSIEIAKGNNRGAAAYALKNAGIPGIRYLDGGSRGAGQGTSNYVVFPGNENMLRILSRE